MPSASLICPFSPSSPFSFLTHVVMKAKQWFSSLTLTCSQAMCTISQQRRASSPVTPKEPRGSSQGSGAPAAGRRGASPRQTDTPRPQQPQGPCCHLLSPLRLARLCCIPWVWPTDTGVHSPAPGAPMLPKLLFGTSVRGPFAGTSVQMETANLRSPYALDLRSSFHVYTALAYQTSLPKVELLGLWISVCFQ